MPFKKGESGNPEGRPQGTKNKINQEIRGKINDFLTDNWEQICTDFQSLEPEKRLLLYEKLLQYSLPKMQATQLDANINEPQIILYKNVSKQFPDRDIGRKSE